MKDNNREEKMTAYWTYLDFLRGRVSGSEFYDAALATAVAADRLKKNINLPTDEEILKAIEEADTPDKVASVLASAKKLVDAKILLPFLNI